MEWQARFEYQQLAGASLDSGNSVSTSAARSWTWIVCRSSIGSASRSPRLSGLGPIGRAASIHGEPPREAIAVNPTDHRHRRVAEPRSVLRDHIQHRLNIRRRAGNHAQDFTRRRLLLQRFLEFLEQPHILNGDNGLVSEGFEQLDLRLGERTHLRAAKRQLHRTRSPCSRSGVPSIVRCASVPERLSTFGNSVSSSAARS